MEWEEFYEAFSSGEEILDKFVFLESYSSSDEVLEVAEALEDKDHRIAFLMSAHRWGTVFEPEDFVELYYYLDDEKLRDYILINSDMEYTKDELELIEGYVSDEALEFVAEKNGFTYFDESPFAKYVDDFNENIEIKQKTHTVQEEKPRSGGFLKGLLGGAAAVGGIFLGAIFQSASEKNKPRVCNGDCANCPPHYGYRYGRWYYGHDHNHGCEFGGNRGSGRMD